MSACVRVRVCLDKAHVPVSSSTCSRMRGRPHVCPLCTRLRTLPGYRRLSTLARGRHTRTFPSGPTPSTPPRHVSTLKTRLRALVASVYRSGQAFAPFATRFVAAVEDARPPGRYNCSFAKRCVRAG